MVISVSISDGQITIFLISPNSFIIEWCGSMIVLYYVPLPPKLVSLSYADSTVFPKMGTSTQKWDKYSLS